MSGPRLLIRLVVALLVMHAAVSRAAADGPSDLSAFLARVGQRVEQDCGRAQSIMWQETVRLEQLGHDMAWDGSHVRRLVYELRVAWGGSATVGKTPEATVLRQLISVNGRPPREGDEPGCMDPKPVS